MNIRNITIILIAVALLWFFHIFIIHEHLPENLAMLNYIFFAVVILLCGHARSQK